LGEFTTQQGETLGSHMSMEARFWKYEVNANMRLEYEVNTLMRLEI
jgi:hypothetical protein